MQYVGGTVCTLYSSDDSGKDFDDPPYSVWFLEKGNNLQIQCINGKMFHEFVSIIILMWKLILILNEMLTSSTVT
jgi:hypothetical protein